MGRRRKPRKQGVKEGYEASPAPQEIAQEKKEREEDVTTLAARVKALEDFRNRDAGFAPAGNYAGAGHTHAFSEITNKVHDNTLHNPSYSAAGHGHPYNEITGTHDNSAHQPKFQTA